MDKRVYNSVAERAGGKCEHCGLPFKDTLDDRPELDHMFGRAKADETVENCWALRGICHRAKTDNFPSKPVWLMHFIVHAGKHGYADAAERAQRELEWDQAKKAVGG